MLTFQKIFCQNQLQTNEFVVKNLCKILKKFSVFGNFENNRCFHMSSVVYKKKGIIHPNGYSFDWAVKAAIPNVEKYTHKPLPRVKTGGRGPNGRMELKCIGGGLNRPYFMVSKFRGGINNESEEIITEKILKIHKNFWRPEFIALVARKMEKRWIFATTSMKVGDLVNSYGKISHLVTRPNQGDAYPVGCLSVGTMVCQIERYPGTGAIYCINAGTHASIVQKLADNSCILKLSDKLIRISSGCSVVIGQMSNVDHMNKKFTKFGQKTWLGIKQRSGLWQRKTGRFGRKIRKPKPPVNFTLTHKDSNKKCLTYTKPEYPAFTKKPGTFENPVHIHRFPVEEGALHPTFKWCSWSKVQ